MPTISFDAVFAEMMQDKNFKAEYEKLTSEFESTKQLIQARINNANTLKQIGSKNGNQTIECNSFRKIFRSNFGRCAHHRRRSTRSYRVKN